MKTARLALFALALLLALFVPGRSSAQEAPAPLQNFVAVVARHWAAGDAEAIVRLAADGRILLDLAGDGPGEVQARNAAAALRRLFVERESVSMRPTQVTISGGTPLRGFGELTWIARSRGVSETESSLIYIGAVWDGSAWRLRELRVLR
jgi:hypothetical protein